MKIMNMYSYQNVKYRADKKPIRMSNIAIFNITGNDDSCILAHKVSIRNYYLRLASCHVTSRYNCTAIKYNLL